jgi:hypothetical protein
MLFLNILSITIGILILLFGVACISAKDWVWRLEQKRLQWNGIRAEREDDWNDSLTLRGITCLIIGGALIVRVFWRYMR